MAKMFYTIEEAAAKLGTTPERVAQLAEQGKLQQFKDRDMLRYKRDQVDAMAASASDESGGPIPLSGGGESSLGGLDAIKLDDTQSGQATMAMSDSTGSAIPLASSGDTDAIKLEDQKKPRKDDPRQATGVSVFDAGEVEHADPMAQTVVSASPSAADEDLALESVGSGSGLLDLTRESDDTSLGAELLDEIYPGGAEGGDTKMETAAGSSGVFDSGATTIDPGASAASTGVVEGIAMAGPPMPTMVEVPVAGETYDPAGSGMSTGALLAAAVALVVAMIVAMSAVAGAPSKITALMAESVNTVSIYAGVLLLAAIIFAVTGFFIGRTQER